MSTIHGCKQASVYGVVVVTHTLLLLLLLFSLRELTLRRLKRATLFSRMCGVTESLW